MHLQHAAGARCRPRRGVCARLTRAAARARRQDKDMVHWKVDFAALQRRCTERGVLMVRHPFPDFSAEGLRSGLPAAVSSLDGLLEAGHRVYLHCTAGMGRSPGVAIAYMYWFRGYATLTEAYEALTSKRPCGPNKEAIRGATCDLLAAHGPLFVLPPLPAQGSTWPEGKGDTLGLEERTNLQRRLRACRPVIIRPDGTQAMSSAWPLPAALGVIAQLLAKLAAAKEAAVAAAAEGSTEKQ